MLIYSGNMNRYGRKAVSMHYCSKCIKDEIMLILYVESNETTVSQKILAPSIAPATLVKAPLTAPEGRRLLLPDTASVP